MINDRTLNESPDQHHLRRNSKTSVEKKLESTNKPNKKIRSLHELVITEKENKRILSNHEKSTKMMDKIKYFINSLTLYITFYILLTKPSYFPYFSALSISAQLIHRYFEFHSYRWQYYLIDFCYLTNLLSILYVFFPTNFYLYIAAFGFASGPILLTIMLYSLPLSFHSTIKFTSYWTHWSPGLSMWIVRWHDTSGFFFGEEYFNNVQLPIQNYLLILLVVYTAWFIPYYFINFIWKYDYILQNDLENTFFYSFKQEGSWSTRKRLLSYDEKWAPLIFMSWHFRYVAATVCLSYCYFFYYLPGFIMFFSIFILGIWNSGTYYIDYFSGHYLDQFKEGYKMYNRVFVNERSEDDININLHTYKEKESKESQGVDKKDS